MAIEDPFNNKEALVFRSWTDDPEQVENLVTLLEAKTQAAPEALAQQWKYGHEYLHDVMFPAVDSEWEPAYRRAFRPSLQSFRSAIATLTNGSRTFGKIPPELVQRFHNVMAERAGNSISNRTPDERLERPEGFWTRDKRLLAAGLTEYFNLTNEETARFFKEKFGADIRLSTINSMRSKWRRDAEFPYDKDRQLSQDDASLELFIKVLEYENSTLNDVLDWLRENSVAPLADRRILRMEELIKERNEKAAG